jgi:hypothetical protein
MDDSSGTLPGQLGGEGLNVGAAGHACQTGPQRDAPEPAMPRLTLPNLPRRT